MSNQDVSPIHDNSVYALAASAVRLVANDARPDDHAPGPELLYSPKVTWSVWGALVDQILHPALLMCLSR